MSRWLFISILLLALLAGCNSPELGSVGKPDLASSGPFSASPHPAASTIKQTSPASPSLSGEKTARSRADDGVFRQSLVQPRPVVIAPRVEPQAPEDPNYVAPKGMTRVEVYAMLEERSRATNEALEARERQRRQARWRPRVDRLNIYLGEPLYWNHGYYGHCWPWHGHHGHGHHGHFGVSLGTW